MNGYNIPFDPETQLCASLNLHEGRLVGLNGKDYVPSQPSLPLDHDVVLPYLAEELRTLLLDEMSRWLWLVATPRSTHVTPIHANAVKGRNIVLTEDPELHLVWISNKVFIKPIPTYLLSHAFWSYFLLPDSKASDEFYETRLGVVRAALGYMRTWVYLIKHESDLRIAKEEHLIPDDVDFEQWTAFIRDFRDVEDWQVADRYHYGDLRLTRLNFWAKPILLRWRFRKEAWQYSDYFARYIAPLLFIFTTWSVVLSGMQVGLQSRPQWVVFGNVSAWFSVATLIGVAATILLLIFLFLLLAGNEIVYAVKAQISKRFGRNAMKRSERVWKKESTKC